MLGVFIMGTAAIALMIAGEHEYNRRPWSLSRFIVTLVVAWIVVAGAAALLLFGVCAVMARS